jgi:peptidoglycan/xylan/chitin deacetylase (PgdA/CDA1 family)
MTGVYAGTLLHISSCDKEDPIMIPLRHISPFLANKAGNLLLSPPIGGLGYFRNHGPRTKRRIAITFDDGPNRPCTEQLLDVMGELGVRGTFFCVGQNTAWHPDIVARLFKEGHDVGNHSQRHRRMASLRPGNRGDHIDESEQAICDVIGCRPRLYRPPWGWLTPWEGARLHKRGYTIVGWDVYTLDWVLPEPDGIALAEKACRDTRPGSILLFHDGYPLEREWFKTETTRAIKHLVPLLRAEGYEFVPASELLGVPAYAPATQNRTGFASL